MFSRDHRFYKSFVKARGLDLLLRIMGIRFTPGVVGAGEADGVDPTLHERVRLCDSWGALLVFVSLLLCDSL